MPWQAVAGSTFCFRPAGADAEHLYFVLNDPLDFDGYPIQSCLIVNASTPKGKHDTTCIIPGGCHPFIDHDSFIYYRYARLEKASKLESWVGPPPQVGCREQPAAPMKLIQHILASMLKSPFAERDLKKCAGIAFDKLMGTARS